MTVCLIDTSVFVEILDVPNMASMRELVLEEFAKKASAREEFVLPMTTILEAGNHIGQNGDGTLRRKTAQFFVRTVQDAIAGRAPYRPAMFIDQQRLGQLLPGFPNWTQQSDAKGKGSGFGDWTIYDEWRRLCTEMPGRRIYIWSLDSQLASFDRQP